jgi:C-terminal processing protease CtpA/Prc
MNLSLFGIGATLENADGYCKIRELVPGGPAARSGLLNRATASSRWRKPARSPSTS